MFCKQCGQQFPDGAVFCPGCGTPVNRMGAQAGPAGTMFRPRDNRMLVGVCAAIARRYGWDLTATRILTVLIGIFVFPLGEIAYLCGWLLIPEEPVVLSRT
ncbi:MAG TPA: PspC domain-containing protein [Acidobacteriaceae bacterium]|jgi:phage shock protein C|nr:PspC domain-containing protein [Acidobacteriaceae bacterium]